MGEGEICLPNREKGKLADYSAQDPPEGSPDRVKVSQGGITSYHCPSESSFPDGKKKRKKTSSALGRKIWSRGGKKEKPRGLKGAHGAEGETGQKGGARRAPQG